MTVLEVQGGSSGSGFSKAVRVVAKTFLEQKHYRQLYRVLSDKWNGYHSLSAAMRLMEAHGVTVAPAEEQRLKELPEEQMIDILVARMPQQSREQFDYFFLQLSLITSTTVRLRTALEEGNADVVDEALESAENVGILNFLLKMAVTQAGREVQQKEAAHDLWVSETEARMAPLLASQAQAVASQKALAQAKAQLGFNRDNAKENAKGVLMGITAGRDSYMLKLTFSGWSDIYKRSRRESEVRKEFEEELHQVMKSLMDVKEKSTANLRGLLLKQMSDGQMRLKAWVFNAFAEEVQDAKRSGAMAAKAAEFEQTLKSQSEKAAENVKTVVKRMVMGDDQGLLAATFNAFLEFSRDYKKNLEMENATKAMEQRVQAFEKRSKETSASVLLRMVCSTSSNFLKLVVQEWAMVVKQERDMEKLREALASKGDLAGFRVRNKMTAFGEMVRREVVQNDHARLLVYSYWKREVKVELMKRYGKERNMKRKQQLMGVKGLFNRFANELETGLKAGTPRIDVKSKHHHHARQPGPQI